MKDSTVERWNGSNGFIFYRKDGEVAINCLEGQEMSVAGVA